MIDTPAARRVARLAAMTVGTTIGLSSIAWFVIYGGSWRGLGIAAVAALVYLIPAVGLQTATERSLRGWLGRARFPMDWIVFVGVKLATAVAAAGLGSLLMLRFRLVNDWDELRVANRMVVVAMVLLTCAIRLYSTTRSRLEERNRALEDKVEAESRELQLHQQDFERAREIQQALMPRQLPKISGCELAAGCQPARIVGGDYFDAMRLPDGGLAIAIGDVSGKGMAAALLMSNLQAIVRAFAPGGLAPHELCGKANQLIAGNVASGKYITFFYGVIDVAHMRLDYCSAGHSPPILRHSDGRLEWLSEGGPVLGVFPGAAYITASTDLQSGDCLVLYTDGITEAMSPTDEEFGEQRLIDLLSEPADGAEQNRQRIMAAVTRFSDGVFHDDATLLILAVA
jgi:phosphoserine phosphatase RsbU/P